MNQLRFAVVIVTVCACGSKPVPRPCTADHQCASDEHCEDGMCVSGQSTCSSDMPCGVGNVCLRHCTMGALGACEPMSGATDFDNDRQNCGQCGNACQRDCLIGHCTCATSAECAPGEVCGLLSICVPAADPCAAVACQAGAVCRDGGCEVVTCTGVLCPAGERCTNGFCAGTPQCKVACATGTCGDRPDGERCDDREPCTSTDECHSGACVGSGIPTWYLDQDLDGLGDVSTPLMTCPAPAGYVRDAGDCDDSSAAVFQWVSLGLDFDRDGYAFDDAGTARCVGLPQLDAGRPYYRQADSGYVFSPPGGLGGIDCDDRDALHFQTIALLIDVDHDGHGVGSVLNRCVGAPTVVSGRNYYSSADAGLVLATGAQAPLLDCDDSNAFIWLSSTGGPDNDGDGLASSVGATCVGMQSGSRWVGPDGGLTHVATGVDCDDTNPLVSTNMSGLMADPDHDGWTSGAIAQRCVGPAMTFGALTYYRAADGGYPWVGLNTAPDCDESDPRAHPDADGGFATPRPGGSWDFNCNGTVEVHNGIPPGYCNGGGVTTWDCYVQDTGCTGTQCAFNRCIVPVFDGGPSEPCGHERLIVGSAKAQSNGFCFDYAYFVNPALKVLCL